VSENKLISEFTIDDLSNDGMRALYQYWLDKNTDDSMPARSDINPSDIKKLLPCIGLVDVEREPSRYRIRLVGSDTVAAMGHDFTGKYLDEMPVMERFVKARYEWVVENKQPYIYFDKLAWSDKSYLTYSTIALPLSGNGIDVDIIMYGMFYEFPNDRKTKPFPISAG